MTDKIVRPSAKLQAKSGGRNHIEQPGEGRKTTQPGERDPQSEQLADPIEPSRGHMLQR